MTIKMLTGLCLFVVRGLGGLLGFCFLIASEFVQCVWNTAVSSETDDSRKDMHSASEFNGMHAVASVGDQPAGNSMVASFSVVDNDQTPDVALAHLQIHDGVVMSADTKVIQLSLYGGTKPRIDRTLRVPAEKLDFQRINWRFERCALPSFTPDIAEKLGLPFNFEGAKAFSLPDFKGDMFKKRMESKATAFAELPALLKQTDPRTSNTPDAHDVPATELGKVSLGATGKVLTANTVLVRPEGKPPYQSFSVTVRTATGDVAFQGNDLAEKFKKYQFSINDLISIKKSSRKFEFTEPNGKTKSRTKNEFEIKVLEKAVA